MKCDQESAVGEVTREIVRRRAADGGRSPVVDNSRFDGADSNGKTERAVGESGAMIRTVRAAMVENLEETLDIDHPSAPWLIKYAGELITSFRVRSDGRTAFKTLKGYNPVKPIVECAEVVHFKPSTTSKYGATCAGIWVGGVVLWAMMRNGGTVIAARDGLVDRVGAIKLKPAGERWSSQWLTSITGTPQSQAQYQSGTCATLRET